MTHRVTFTQTRTNSSTPFYGIRNNPERPADLEAHADLEALLTEAENDGRLESMSVTIDGDTMTGILNYRDEEAANSVMNAPATEAYDTAQAAYNTDNGITMTVSEETV